MNFSGIIDINIERGYNPNDPLVKLVDQMYARGDYNIGPMFENIRFKVTLTFNSTTRFREALLTRQVYENSTSKVLSKIYFRSPYSYEQAPIAFLVIQFSLAEAFAYLRAAVPPALQHLIQNVKSVEDVYGALLTMIEDISNPSQTELNQDIFIRHLHVRPKDIGLDMSKEHPMKKRLKMLYDGYPRFKKEFGFSLYIPSATTSIKKLIELYDDEFEDSHPDGAQILFYTEDWCGLSNIAHYCTQEGHEIAASDFYKDKECWIVTSFNPYLTEGDKELIRVAYSEILHVI